MFHISSRFLQCIKSRCNVYVTVMNHQLSVIDENGMVKKKQIIFIFTIIFNLMCFSTRY